MPTQGATLKKGSVSPQLNGPYQSVGVHQPNVKSHTVEWESMTPKSKATPKGGSPSLKFGSPSPEFKKPHQRVEVHCSTKEPRQRMGSHHGHSKGHTKRVGVITSTQGARPKRVCPSGVNIFLGGWGGPALTPPPKKTPGPLITKKTQYLVKKNDRKRAVLGSP